MALRKEWGRAHGEKPAKKPPTAEEQVQLKANQEMLRDRWVKAYKRLRENPEKYTGRPCRPRRSPIPVRTKPHTEQPRVN